MSNNKHPYESEFWVFFVTFLFPPRRGFLCLFLLYNGYLLCTTLCICTVFDKSAVFFLLKDKKKQKTERDKACFLTDKIFCNTSILKYIRRETYFLSEFIQMRNIY